MDWSGLDLENMLIHLANTISEGILLEFQILLLIDNEAESDFYLSKPHKRAKAKYRK